MLFERLYVRLALTTGLLFVVAGGALIWTSMHTSELHLLETTQRVNRDIALHAAEDMPLLESGQVNEGALKELAHHVMFINPIVEVYLLDPEGRILSHALPYGTVLRDTVTMAPLQAFLGGEQKLPIFGDDPRSVDGRKTFSVSPIPGADGAPQAYLYTVLQGQDYHGIAQTLADSYNLRVGMVTIAAALAVTLLGGLLIFFFLTRRLHSLSVAVKAYREGSYEQPLALAEPVRMRDEVDELTVAIRAMGERIEQQFDAQREIDRNRRELIANVSHDLRTPVSSVQGYLETVLVKDLEATQQRDYLETAHRQCTRLNELIGELFELSTLESGTVEPEWEAFPVMELVQDIVHDHELGAQELGVTLRAEASRNSIEVVADIAMIHRVLDNLIHNALKHTRPGGEVTVRVTDNDDRVQVKVVDTGVGIAAKDIPHIFERFYRPDSEGVAEIDANAGRGLGLAIVKRIIDLHQSQIAVRSEKNAGAEFLFWLPQPA